MHTIRYYLDLITEAEAKEKPLAVIVKGNPKYLRKPKIKPLADAFYDEIERLLKAQGFKVEIDPGRPYTTPNTDAKVWLAHSRGIDRLRFAPKSVKTIELKTKDYDNTYNSHDERGVDPLHYQLSDEDHKAIQALKPPSRMNESRQKMRPSPKDLADIQRKRHEIRCSERNGGQCGWVTEYCQARWGWERISGTYCNDTDEPMCDGHVWCVLPDGAIFDPTADQLGLGHDMRIVLPTDPDFHKYRPEWTDEFNPDLHQEYPELKGVSWSGKYDYEWSHELRKERGDDWHVTDRKQHANYIRQREAYRSGKADPKKPFY